MGIFDTLGHVAELTRELMQPGELRKWHRVDPREEARRMVPPIPPDSSCYPYHQRLDEAQLVHEEDFRS